MPTWLINLVLPITLRVSLTLPSSATARVNIYAQIYLFIFFKKPTSCLAGLFGSKKTKTKTRIVFHPKRKSSNSDLASHKGVRNSNHLQNSGQPQAKWSQSQRRREAKPSFGEQVAPSLRAIASPLRLGVEVLLRGEYRNPGGSLWPRSDDPLDPPDSRLHQGALRDTNPWG